MNELIGKTDRDTEYRKFIEAAQNLFYDHGYTKHDLQEELDLAGLDEAFIND